MAKLIDHNAIVEIDFVDNNDYINYVLYSMKVSYDKKSFVNPELVSQELFMFDDYQHNCLGSFFKELLENERRSVYIPLEFDIFIEAEFLPKYGLKEAKSNPNLAYISNEKEKELRDVDEERKKSDGKLPDDNFVLLFLVSSAQLRGSRDPDSNNHGGSMPVMKLCVSRRNLEDFVIQLEREFEEYEVKRRQRIFGQ